MNAWSNLDTHLATSIADGWQHVVPCLVLKFEVRIQSVFLDGADGPADCQNFRRQRLWLVHFDTT
jgi:hypothetical protein